MLSAATANHCNLPGMSPSLLSPSAPLSLLLLLPLLLLVWLMVMLCLLLLLLLQLPLQHRTRKSQRGCSF